VENVQYSELNAEVVWPR